MTRLKLKVCGMRDLANIHQVEALSPDLMGFIFYPSSKRFVGTDFQMPVLAPTIAKVGVFVNASPAEVVHLAKAHALDFVQLHGAEPVGDCEEIAASGVKVIKVFSVDAEFDFADTKAFAKAARYFLFDTKTPTFGGSGRVFDWELLKKYDQSVPFILSGGLSPENVADIKTLRGVNLYGVDVNSGVEVAPGLKDIEKVKQVKNSIEL